MAAVIHLDTGLHLDTGPHADPSGRAARPNLRLLPGGRSAGRHPSLAPSHGTFLLRRAIVAVAVAALAVLLLQGLGALSGLVVGPALPPVSSSGQVHVVEPGDTMWSIARAVVPQGDARILVDDLLALNGDAPLQVGQQLVLPSSMA